ncbi:hypothetical protein KAU34_09365, partial [candidate division WOR-3 bacterium]|nr:hypothetical protein [candidate division WOR-3 bacterium]
MKKIYIKCLMGIFIITFFLLSFFSSLIAHNWENPFLRSNEFLLDSNIVYIPTTGSSPSIAYDGTNYFVVWTDTRYTGIEEGFYSREYYDIFGARVNQSGELIDSAGIQISINPYNQGNPAIAYDGTNYIVVWHDERNQDMDIYGARVSSSGVTLDTADIAISTDALDQRFPSVAFGTNNYLVVWGNHNFGGIKGVRIGKDGSILDTASIEISLIPVSQMFPDILYNGRNFFVVWYSYPYGENILGAMIDTSGFLLDTIDIPISLADNRQIYPSVAFDGRNHLAVWKDERTLDDLYGARIDTSGSVIDTAGIHIFSWVGDYSAITFGSRNYLALFQKDHYIRGIRIDTSGTIIDTAGILISTTSANSPSVTFGDNNYFAVWHSGAIKGTRVDTSGTMLDSSGIFISSAAYPQWYPYCIFNGKNYFIVWQDKRNGSDYDVYGARVDTTGVVINPDCIPISTEVVNQQFPKVAFSGSNSLVVWQDDRFGNINGARVDTSGVVLEPSGFTISGAPNKQESPSVTFGGKHYFVVWHD